MPATSPKDRFITVYGRNPVLEVLGDPALDVDKVLLAEGSRGAAVHEIRTAAGRRGVPLQTVSADRVKKLAGNGRQDQGVLADVVAPRMRPLADAVDDGRLQRVLVLDGITTPANAGMIIRSATAAGIDGIVVPRRGVASLDPMVVKASAGVAFRAPLLTCYTAAEALEALRDKGFRTIGLAADATSSVHSADLSGRVAIVLGSETTGLTPDVVELVDEHVAIPMPGQVESLNVSAAAAVVVFELARRDAAAQTPAGRDGAH